MRRYLLAGVSALALIVGAGQARATAFLLDGANFQSYVVPTTGEYQITAFGAEGGANSNSTRGSGGLGAEVQGDIALLAGTTLTIGVGGKGTNGLNYYGGGGGGLSFVESGSYGAPGSVLLAVAGGGGGGGYSGPGGPGVTTTAGGLTRLGSGASGINGSGGQAYYGRPPNGSGGAGFTGAFNNGESGGTYGGGGNKYGGNAGSPYGGYGPFGGYGGYMGGGGAGFEPGGGGGGYSGGGGGGSDYGGGGGGSFLASSFSNRLLASGMRSGNGTVTIDPVTSVPEPGSLALLATGLLALGLVGRRRRRT